MTALSDVKNLSIGCGLCTPDQRLLIRPFPEMIALGIMPDVLRAVFSAVHRVNRKAFEDQRLALTLPEMDHGYGIHKLGSRIVVFGTTSLLDRVADDKDLMRLVDRGAFKIRRREVDCSPGDPGCFLVRSRDREPTTDQSLSRQQRRDQRRATHIQATAGRYAGAKKAKPIDLSMHPCAFVTMREGLKMNIRAGQKTWNGDDVIVSTYGLSTPSRIATLPLDP